jgi:hypothetical protein
MPRSLTDTATGALLLDSPDGLNIPCNAFAQLGGHLIWAEKSAQPLERRPDFAASFREA